MPSRLYRTPAVLYKFVMSNSGTEIATVFTEKEKQKTKTNKQFPYSLYAHSSLMDTDTHSSCKF